MFMNFQLVAGGIDTHLRHFLSKYSLVPASQFAAFLPLTVT